jgi:hypothetical protein
MMQSCPVIGVVDIKELSKWDLLSGITLIIQVSKVRKLRGLGDRIEATLSSYEDLE